MSLRHQPASLQIQYHHVKLLLASGSLQIRRRKSISLIHEHSFSMAIKERLERDHALVAWMVIHSAEMINRYQVGKDGKTAYERWKGNKFCSRFLRHFSSLILSATTNAAVAVSLTSC